MREVYPVVAGVFSRVLLLRAVSPGKNPALEIEGYKSPKGVTMQRNQFSLANWHDLRGKHLRVTCLLMVRIPTSLILPFCSAICRVV
ncbi:hypothetical protein C8R31_10229 [Nitrosospira sp. Nsp2]|nr:hypothetical protein C8R31_10229 [Nitrosospira sp. Nsp2]